MSVSVTITFGRNVGVTPLRQREWDAFRQDVRDCAVIAPDAWIAYDGSSIGSWDGVEEENHCVVIIGTFGDLHLALFRATLARLRSHYEQDAIGFVFGQSELV